MEAKRHVSILHPKRRKETATSTVNIFNKTSPAESVQETQGPNYQED